MTGDGMRRGLADTIISDYGDPTVWLRHDYRIWYRCSGISSNGETAIFHASEYPESEVKSNTLLRLTYEHGGTLHNCAVTAAVLEYVKPDELRIIVDYF